MAEKPVGLAVAIQAVAEAVAPTYNEGELAPLSVDLAGNLRTKSSGGGGGGGTVDQGSANTVANAWPILVTDGVDTALVSAAGALKVDGSAATQPVSGPLTDAQLRAVPVPVSGTVTASGPLTDVQLRASAVPVSGPLTDAQLRATPVPVSGTVTASGPLTDAQLRATAVSTTAKVDLAPASPTAASVGVASAQAVAANANRKGLVLVNTSANTISLGFGSAAVLNNGITLYPSGVYEMDEYTFDLGAVNAIASAAASNLAIQEYA